MFCSFCKNANKPYNTHFVKDTNGVIICPTLLALSCSYCKKQGHTIKHCDTLKLKNKARKQAEAEINRVRQAQLNEINKANENTNKTTVKKPINMFELLENEEAEEEVEEKKVNKKYTSLADEEW